MKKILLSAFLIASTSLYGVNTKPTLDYLNTLRIQADLLPFSKESNIEKAAQNHSNYSNAHNEGHDETEGLSYYTGVEPEDRGYHTGYSSGLSEVISYGSTGEEAIDLLFSAIYHRFILLSADGNEIGIGIKSGIYTLDLGNKWVDSICAGPASTSSSASIAGFYCKDSNKKIDFSAVDIAENKDKKTYGKLTLWPPSQGEGTSTSFYGESPDPLPNTSVSGYPISVEFNNFKFKTPPTVNSFTVENALTQQDEDDISIMNSENDPNGWFTNYQTAFFPSSVLDWGTPYNAEIIYTYKGTQYSKTWCFQTRTLQGVAQRVYTIKHNQNISLNILRGEKYAINIVPNDGNDLVGWPISWSGTDDAITFDNYVDSVFTISSDSPIGSTFGVEFENGQKINFTISDSDQANFPKNVSCLIANDFDYDHDGLLNSVDLDDDNDGYSDIDEELGGSNPLSASSRPLDTDGDFIPNFRDPDDDNDGISDRDEIKHGLNPLKASDGAKDMDHDGFSNAMEISLGTDPTSPKSAPKWTPVLMGSIVVMIPSVEKDTDGDYIPDDRDPDDDNDGVIDRRDRFPLDPHESIDTDGDGIGNNADKDDDNDGISDRDEIKYGLNPLKGSDAEADFDHDGFSNAMEISVGTNIRSKTSKPIWAPVFVGDIITFIPSHP